MNMTRGCNHILEHTRTPTTAAINYYLPGSHPLGMALPWTAPSHIPHRNSSETAAPCSAPSSVFLSLSTWCDLVGHRYLKVQTVALGHESSLTFPPPISIRSVSSQSPRSFPFSCPQWSFHLHPLLLKTSFPVYSLSI